MTSRLGDEIIVQCPSIELCQPILPSEQLVVGCARQSAPRRP